MLLKELFGSWSSKLVSKLVEGSGLDAGGGEVVFGFPKNQKRDPSAEKNK